MSQLLLAILLSVSMASTAALEASLPPSQITPRLWLGSSADAYNRSWLQANSITHIVTVARECEIRFPSDFVYIHAPVLDSITEDLLTLFPAMTQLLDRLLLDDQNELQFPSNHERMSLSLPSSDASMSDPFGSTMTASTSMSSPVLLVHCVSGLSRSPSIILAWLITRFSVPLIDSFKLIIQLRKIAPNRGFMFVIIRIKVQN